MRSAGFGMVAILLLRPGEQINSYEHRSLALLNYNKLPFDSSICDLPHIIISLMELQLLLESYYYSIAQIFSNQSLLWFSLSGVLKNYDKTLLSGIHVTWCSAVRSAASLNGLFHFTYRQFWQRHTHYHSWRK